MGDEHGRRLVRLDGSGVTVAVTLGADARVYLDDGEPPILVIETPTMVVTVEAYEGEPGALPVVAALAREAQRLRAAVERAAPHPR